MKKLLQSCLTVRGLAGSLAFASVVGMAFAFFYLQKSLMLMPCPLCILQRIGLIVMGVFSLLMFLINPNKKWQQMSLMTGALLGIGWSVGVAGWHVWLQHLPPAEVPACGPGLDYWLDTLPISQVFTEIFKGSGECATVDWTFLGFSIPELSLMFFLILTMMVITALVKIYQQK